MQNMQIPTIKHKDLSFININKPTNEQLRHLHEKFGFSILNLEDYLYKTQIPKIEFYDDYILFVLDTPSVQQGKAPILTKASQPTTSPFAFGRGIMPLPKNFRRRRIAIGEVDFFIGKDYLVVLHDEKTPQIDQFFDLCKTDDSKRKEFMDKGPAFLFYWLADNLVDTSFSYVTELTNTIDAIDRQLEEKSTSSVIEDISITRRNIVVFETMIKPTLPIFTDLERGKYPQLGEEMIPYWSNVLDHLQKIWDRLEDNKELIQGIASSHESILSNRSNELVKFLTVITSISFPFVIVNNLYSMNVQGLPFSEQPWIVPFLFLLIFSGGTLIIAYFKYRDWL